MVLATLMLVTLSLLVGTNAFSQEARPCMGDFARESRMVRDASWDA